MKTSFIKGQVTRAFNGKTKFDDTLKNRITIKCVNIESFREEVEKEEVYKNSGKKMTPKWTLDSDYVNLNSKFDIPTDGDCKSFEDILHGAKVTIKVSLKDGAIYPTAIRVHENGVEDNPFEDFDDGDFDLPMEV